jgi:predicted phosphodiesterase
MEKITDIVIKQKIEVIVFLGDLVGVNEKNIRDRQLLMRFIMFFAMLNKLTNGNVFAVKGNHDCGEFTDFDMLLGMGFIKNPKYINYYGKKPGSSKYSGLEVRFHLVNYGDEHLKLALTKPEDNASNVVLGHNDYYIDGVTNWFSAGGDVQLSNLDNFIGVDLVVSGHIHIPSEEILYTTLKDGSSISLFYLGCPLRVSERYNDCWYLTFNYAEDGGDWSTSYDAHQFGLAPVDDVFFPREDFVDDVDDEVVEQARKSEALKDIVSEIIAGRITSGDLFRQIDVVPGASPEAKAMAKKYLELAKETRK